jgi:hypothetical protein
MQRSITGHWKGPCRDIGPVKINYIYSPRQPNRKSGQRARCALTKKARPELEARKSGLITLIRTSAPGSRISGKPLLHGVWQAGWRMLLPCSSLGLIDDELLLYILYAR